MECPQRQDLEERLRVATHEMKWLLEQLLRVATENPAELIRYNEVVEGGIKTHRKIFEQYREHVTEHGCQTVKAVAGE